jgi:hypothetical protein
LQPAGKARLHFVGLAFRPWTSCAILEAMRSRASRIIVTLALLTCLICPLLETLDTWITPFRPATISNTGWLFLRCAWEWRIRLRDSCLGSLCSSPLQISSPICAPPISFRLSCAVHFSSLRFR